MSPQNSKASPSNDANSHHEPRFNLLLTGEVLDGFEAAAVQRWLSQTLKVSHIQAATLLSGKSSCVKQNLNKQSALQYRAAFQAKGVAVQVQRRISAAAKTAQNTQNLGTPRQKKSPANAQNTATQVVSTQYFNGEPNAHPSRLRIAAAFIFSALSLLSVVVLYVTSLSILLGFAVNRIVAALLRDTPIGLSAGIFGYALPLLLSLCLLALLLRPLLARKHLQTQKISIDPKQQPKLIQFVTEIYQLAGTSAPTRITLSNELHCASEYHYTFRNMLSGTTSLTIGMPLLVTLHSRQLAALVAHQASLYNSNVSALLHTLHTAIQERFTGATDNDDAWTRVVDNYERGMHGKFRQLLTTFAHQFLNLSATLLRPFSLLLNLSGNFSKQYWVYNADHIAVSMVGSREFVETFNQLHLCNHAFHEANDNIFGSIGERRLANNLPALIRHYASITQAKVKKRLVDEVSRGETRRHFDYPSDRERIIRAEDLDLTGLVSQDIAAIDLLDNRTAICKQSTLYFYKNQGLEFHADQLVDVKELATLAQKDQLRDELSATYFNQWFAPHIFWKIPSPENIKQLSTSERLALLNENIARIRHATPDYTKLMAAEPKLFEHYVQLATANEIRKAGYTCSAADLHLSEEQSSNLSVHYEKAKMDYTGTRLRLQKISELMGSRLFLGIALHPEAPKRQFGIMLLQTLVCLYEHNQQLDVLRARVAFLPILSARAKEKKEVEHIKKIQRVNKDIRQLSANALQALDKFKCGFHDEYATVGQFVRAHVKQDMSKEDPTALESIAYYYEVLQGMHEANRMMNNQLALIAKDSEQTNHITPVRLTA